MGVLAIQDVTPPERRHRWHHIAIIILTFLIVIAASVLVFMFLTKKDEGIFNYDDETLRSMYAMDSMPEGSATGIMVVVFIWQILWTLYSLSTIPRPIEGGYLYYRPKYMCMYISLVYDFAVILHMIWLFLWDAEKMVPQVSVLAASTVLMGIALFMSLKAMMCGGLELLKNGKSMDVLLARLLVQNGIAMYFTFLLMSTFIQIGLVVSVETGMSAKDASSLSLALIGFYIILKGILCIWILDKYTRYLFGGYVVEVWILLGIVINGWDGNNRNSIIAVVILVLAILMLFTKIALVIKRGMVNPEPLYECMQSSSYSATYNTQHVYDHNQHIDGVINLPPPRDDKPPVEVLNFITPEPGRTYVYREQTTSVPVRQVFESAPSCTASPPTTSSYDRPATPYVDHRAPQVEVLNAPIHATYRGYGGHSRAHSTIRGAPMGLINVPGMAMPAPQPTCTPIQPVFVPTGCGGCAHRPASMIHTCSPPTLMSIPQCGHGHGCGHGCGGGMFIAH